MRQKRIVQILVVSIAAYVLLAFGAYALQRRLLYPRRGSGAVPELSGATLETFAGTAGNQVHALYAKAPDDAPTLVHFHGNGEELADMVEFVALFRRRGFGVLAVEYPGYGLSRAVDPTESAIYRDAELALKDLHENKGVPRERIVLSGQSLGTGVAVEMASRGHGARLLLLSPYTSIIDMANRYLPFLPNRWLVRDLFDSARKAPAIQTPALVIHGTNDEVIPFALGRTLAGLLPNARFLPIERGRHGDLFMRGGTTLLDDITTFCHGDARQASR